MTDITRSHPGLSTLSARIVRTPKTVYQYILKRQCNITIYHIYFWCCAPEPREPRLNSEAATSGPILTWKNVFGGACGPLYGTTFMIITWLWPTGHTFEDWRCSRFVWDQRPTKRLKQQSRMKSTAFKLEKQHLGAEQFTWAVFQAVKTH